MHIPSTPTRCVLARRQSIRIERPLHARLRAERGALWITIDGEAQDIELAAGASYEFDSEASAVVGAFEDAVFTAVQPPARRWWQRAVRVRGGHRS